ncbi:MAG: hypothetical protein WDZ52_05710 [Pseudohongiellaceae bacterium]
MSLDNNTAAANLYHLRLFKKLSVFLVMLLLSNSSLALEILTHDGHQHAEPHKAQHAMHAMHDMSEAQTDLPALDNLEHAEDCICDDICCVSSIGFGLSVNGDQFLPFVENRIASSNFYRSIAIDILLPPPTR